jgi:hypothetical protein
LPYSLTLGPGKKAFLFMTGIILVFTLTLAGVGAWLNDGFLFISSDRLHNFLVLFAIVVIVMVMVMLALFLSPAGRQTIDVTEQGLRARFGGQKGVVRWEEARLFAMYPTWGVRKSGSSITYELSSTTDIARWTWVLRPTFFPQYMVPTVPRDDYHRQMQALNALIVARTGLPLANLGAEAPSDGQRGRVLDPLR